jgi:hypothetical protein
MAGPAPAARIDLHSSCDMDTSPDNFLAVDDAGVVADAVVVVQHAAVAVAAWGADPAEALALVVVAKKAGGQNSAGPRGCTAAAARQGPAGPAAADGHSLCLSSKSRLSC